MASYIDPSFRESLLKKPQDRTAQDLTLINANLKSLEALSSLRDTTIRNLCKTVRYVKHEANDVLYRTGDVISCWYILLSGSVFIDGSMFLPRSGFGRRSTGQIIRIHDCLVLETSEMLVIDYPPLKPTNNQQPTEQLKMDSSASINNQITTIQVTSNKNINSNDFNNQNFINQSSFIHTHPFNNNHNYNIYKTSPNINNLNNHNNNNNQRIIIKNHYINNLEDDQNNDVATRVITSPNILKKGSQSQQPKMQSFATASYSISNNLTTFKTLANSTPTSPIIVTKSIRNDNGDIYQLNSNNNVTISSTTSVKSNHLNVNKKLLNDNQEALHISQTSSNDGDHEFSHLNNSNKLDLEDAMNDTNNSCNDINVHNLNIIELNEHDYINCKNNKLLSIDQLEKNSKSIYFLTGNHNITNKKFINFQQTNFSKNDILNKSQQTINSTIDNENENEEDRQSTSLIISNAPSNYALATSATIINTTSTTSSTKVQPQQNQTHHNNHNIQFINNNNNCNLKKNAASRSSSSISSKSSSIISNMNINQTSNMCNELNNLTTSSSIPGVVTLKNNISTGSGSINDDATSEQSIQMVKDAVREVLEKDPKERSEEDIDILFEFMQSFPAFSDLTQPIIRKLCSCMVLGVVDKADTIVLDHNEKLDSWAVVLNGHVESVLPDNTIKSYHVGDHFGVQATLDPVYNEGIMRTKCDDCQFVLVKQNDYYEILNQSKENTKSYFENNKLVMVTEYRFLNNSSDKQGEILLRATPDKLIERLINDDPNTILDPTYIQDFLLTYRVFIETPTYISNKLYEFFENSAKSSSLAVSTMPTMNVKKKVYRIVLEWITNHFNDFETNKELYDFVEKFQDTLNKEKMNEQFRVLTIAISTKSKQRTVTLARSKRDESLMFNIQGGWDKGYGVFISKVDKDSKATEIGIRKGDQIIEVNGHSFQHITLTSALETLKSFTHLSIVLKYNPIGFNEMLLHPEKSPHRNKKNFVNNNKAYLIEYLQMQQQNHQQLLQQQQNQETSVHNDSNNSFTSNGGYISSPKFAHSSNVLINHLQSSNTSINSVQPNNLNNKKSIGSIPPLPPSSMTSLTPRNKSKDKFKFLNSNTNLNSKESGTSNSNHIKKILGRFNKKAHSKDLESLQPSDSSAPALKSITRSPSPSLSNFNSTTSFNTSSNSVNNKLNNLTTSDYSSNLSRNNSSNNLANNSNGASNIQLFDESLAKMSLQDQQQFVGEHVLKIYKNDQNFKYLVVHKETSTKEVVMLALNEFNINDDMGSNAYSLCEVSVDQDRLIKQKRLPDQMNNLAERLPLNARYYLRSNTLTEQFLSDPQAVEELIKDWNITFLQLDPLEISAQLTLRDYCIFKSIESSEYIDYLFKKNSKFGFTHLNQFSDLSNEEMFWVINEVLHESNLIKRVKIIKHFIQIAQICKECKNFNSLFAILSGLDHMSVTRLKDTWDKVSNKYKKILQDLKQLLDPSFNMVKYRQLVKSESIQPPIIPFFPICQKDLYFIKEFGETTVDGLMNFEKLRKLSKSVRSIVQMTSSSFDLTSMRDVPTSHSVIFSMFGCNNASLIEYRGGNGAYHQLAKLNIRADHVKKLYEESVMVRKVRHYLNSIFKNIERNEERLRLISSTLEHSTSGNTLKRKPSPNSSLGGSLSSINALNNSSNIHNISNGSSIGNGITSGNGTLGNQKSSLFGTHSPDAVKKLLALSETKVKTVKSSTSSTTVPLSHMNNSRNSPSTNANLVSSLSNHSNINSHYNHISSSPTIPLSPKAKQRSISSSQPLNNKYNYSIPLSSESSSVSTIKLNGKYTLDKSSSSTNGGTTFHNNTSNKLAISSNHHTHNPALNIINNSEADSGRASMASNVDQDQCSPTFQQRAFLLNRYLGTDHQQPIIKSMNNNNKTQSNSHNEIYLSSKFKNVSTQRTLDSSNLKNSEEEQDQVSAV